MSEEPWYETLRNQWRPGEISLLLIGESAPDPGIGERRFFYAPTISSADNLFRGVLLAMYDARVTKGDDRAPWLERLRDDGVWLIDLVKYPVDKKSTGRARARRDNVSERMIEIRDLAPRGIIICHSPTFALLAPPLLRAGLPVLHDTAIPFPDGVHRADFVNRFRTARGAAS